MNLIKTDIISSREDAFWEQPAAALYLEPRPVLVLTSDLTPGSGEEEQLRGILSSGCRLLTEQYHVIEAGPNDRMAWHKLREQLQPRVVLLFNVSPQQLGVSALFRLNDVNNFDDARWVPSFPLSRIMQDTAVKGELWNNALKPLFVDKKYGDPLVKRD